MEKHYEEMKEMLDEQIKKILKKGDITPQELDNLYKASAIVLDFETKDAMKKSEQQGQGQQQNQQMGAEAPNGGYSPNKGQSNHYPWWMMSGRGSYANYNDGMSNNQSNAGNSYSSYGPVWNQSENMSNEASNNGRSNDYSRNNSNNRGSYNQSNNNSNNSYNQSNNSNNSYNDRSYENAYDGAYDSSYEDGSYRRGRDARTGRYVSRDRGYSRALDKERMIGKLEDMMDDAPSEKERRALRQCVAKLEQQ